MNLQEFRQCLNQNNPPHSISIHLQALWYDAQNNWEKAHELIQDETDAMSSRIHAYLHRKEGDTANAGYWYRRAGTTPARVSLEQEWEQLVSDYGAAQ
jgi:hypothetical protein